MGIKEQLGVDVWQKQTQHCKVIIIQIKKKKPTGKEIMYITQ